MRVYHNIQSKNMHYYIYEFNKSKMRVNQNNIKKTLQECLF